MSRFQRHQMTIGVVLLTVGVTLLFYWLYFSATGGPRLPELTAPRAISPATFAIIG